MTSDVHYLTAIEAGQKIAEKQLSPVDLTGEILARIETKDPDIGAFAVVTDDRAFVAARQVEAEIAQGVHRGPLHGVPIAVKSLCDVAGEPNAAGTTILDGPLARKNATVVRRLEAAGAVLLGTLTMTEGASAVHHPDVTPPKNPWDPNAWTGASSSGSGAATAAGFCFGSLGSDTAGSIRAPSHFCGVVGLKPTYGRVSRAGVFPLSATLDHVGPMTRTVADCAAMLSIIAGQDPRDPTTEPGAVPDYLADLEGPLTGYRIGFDEAYATEGVDSELADAIGDAVRVLAAAGATIVPIELPERDGALQAGAIILHADVAMAHEAHFPGNEERYGPHLREMITIGQSLDAVSLAKAHELRRHWSGELQAQFSEIDAIICPPTVAPAPPAHLTGKIPSDFRTQARFFGFTLPYTVSGNPSLTVPCGFTGGGLPLAFQLIGPHFDEARLMRAGHRYQQETTWHHRHPSL